MKNEIVDVNVPITSSEKLFFFNELHDLREEIKLEKNHLESETKESKRTCERRLAQLLDCTEVNSKNIDVFNAKIVELYVEFESYEDNISYENDEIKKKKKRIKEIFITLKSGLIEKTVECEKKLDEENKETVYFFNGNEVYRRETTANDKQEELF